MLNGQHVSSLRNLFIFVKFQIYDLIGYCLLYAGAVFTGMIFLQKGFV
jgi:hypothetical protein